MTSPEWLVEWTLRWGGAWEGTLLDRVEAERLVGVKVGGHAQPSALTFDAGPEASR